MFNNNLENILLVLSFIIFGFLALREIFTWYWKINRIIELLEKIEENTRK
ncbi:MAG: hypothetical protein JWP09_883 [Candidatus Taylorbacteria bacterium]|nr:hypothetical protein [Candidatus Taylorbacteria bacterium]